MPPGPTPVTLKFHCLGGSNTLARVTLKVPFLNHAPNLASLALASVLDKPFTSVAGSAAVPDGSSSHHGRGFESIGIFLSSVISSWGSGAEDHSSGDVTSEVLVTFKISCSSANQYNNPQCPKRPAAIDPVPLESIDDSRI